MEEGHGKTPYALTPEQYGSFLIRLFRLWYKDLRKGRQPFIIRSGKLPLSCRSDKRSSPFWENFFFSLLPVSYIMSLWNIVWIFLKKGGLYWKEKETI